MEKTFQIWIDVLEFLSFWMLAPELLGEKRMQQLEKGFLKLEPAMPGLLFGLMGFVVGKTMARLGNHFGDNSWWLYAVVGFMVLYLAMMFFYLKSIAQFVATRIFRPFFQRLSDSSVFRSQLLKTGALLFSLSFGMKMLAYFHW
jgi:hypothetical protein